MKRPTINHIRQFLSDKVKTKAITLLLTVSIASLSGCATTPRFHNPQNAKIANDIATVFEESQEGATNLFTVMKQNLESADKASEKLLDVLVETQIKTFVATLPSTKWSLITADLTRLDERLTNLKAEADQNLTVLMERKKKSDESIELATIDLKSAEKLLKQGLISENLWTARHELWRSSLGVLSDSIASGGNSFNLEGLQKIRDDILATEIETRKLGDRGEIETGKTTLEKIFEDDLKEMKERPNKELLNQLGIDTNELEVVGQVGNLASVLGLFRVDVFDPSSAPGIKVLLLNLAVDLADVQLKRGKIETDYLAEHIAHWNLVADKIAEPFSLKFAINLYKNLEKDQKITADSTVLDSLNFWKSRLSAEHNAYDEFMGTIPNGERLNDLKKEYGRNQARLRNTYDDTLKDLADEPETESSAESDDTAKKALKDKFEEDSKELERKLEDDLENLNETFDDALKAAENVYKEELEVFNGDLAIVQARTDLVEATIRHLYQLLLRYSVTKNVDATELKRLELRTSVINHNYSISLSAINAQERAILIQSGLDALKVYHDGGVRPEQLANLLRAAETVALGFVAGD